MIYLRIGIIEIACPVPSFFENGDQPGERHENRHQCADKNDRPAQNARRLSGTVTDEYQKCGKDGGDQR